MARLYNFFIWTLILNKNLIDHILQESAIKCYVNFDINSKNINSQIESVVQPAVFNLLTAITHV